MQGQESVLYFQPRTLTPSALMFAAARRERLARMERAALQQVVKAIECTTADRTEPPPVEKPQQESPDDDWADRQKKLWFGVVADLGPVTPRAIHISDIQKAAANFYNSTVTDMCGPRRTAQVVRARQIAMYLAKTLTLRSLPDVGRRFGNRDHTTVLHAVRKIEGLLPRDPNLVAEIEFLKSEVSACTARNTAAMPVE